MSVALGASGRRLSVSGRANELDENSCGGPRRAVARAALDVRTAATGQCAEVTAPVGRGAGSRFALLAVHARVPVGLELHDDDDPQPFRLSVKRPDPGVVEESVPLATVIDAFNSAQREYRAELMDGVMVVRPRTGRAAFLDGASGLEAVVTVTGVTQALRTVFSPLDPGLAGPWVGSSYGPLEDLTSQVTIDGSPGRTVMNTLNQIAGQRQAGWYVVTRGVDRRREIARFGSLQPRLSRSTMAIKPRSVP